jgi:muconate cycloisomerase
MHLKIERVDVYGIAMPLVGEYKNAYLSKSLVKAAVVRVTASGGLTGCGSIEPTPGYSKESVEDGLRVLETVLAPLVVGMDPTNVHRILDTMHAAVSGAYEAKAAIEMACVDLAARAAGVPVHAYLGGAVRERVSFNAWIGILPPEEAARETVHWKEQGFRSAKVKVGGDIRADRDRIAAIREAVGPEFHLRIDANAGYDADTSIELARMVAPYRLQLFEQPVSDRDLAGMARVRREANALGIPIMADESVSDHASLIRIIKADAVDIVKVKVMKQGGLLTTRRMIATAEAAGIRCVVGHGFGLGPHTMAEIMVAATSNNVLDGLECVGPLKTREDVIAERLDLSGGSLALPGGPGLGVTLDDARLAQYRLEAHAGAT